MTVWTVPNIVFMDGEVLNIFHVMRDEGWSQYTPNIRSEEK